MQKRNQIINYSRSWIGTKFHYQGRVKKTDHHSGGVDCIGLLMGVAKEAKILTKHQQELIKLDELNYPKIAVDNKLSDILDANLPIKTEIDIADLILFKFDNYPQHLAIVTELNPVKIIHSYLQARKVAEHYLDENWYQAIYRIYSLV